MAPSSLALRTQVLRLHISVAFGGPGRIEEDWRYQPAMETFAFTM